MSPLTDLIDQLGGWPVLETEGSPWNELQFQWDEMVFKLRDNGRFTYSQIFLLLGNITTLVTRIEEVLRIAVMGGKFFHVMLPLEDMVEFMDTNMVRIRVLVYQV